MPRQKKQNIEEEAPDGAPEWMVTFSDCMTLLLTFFVLLLSFSSFDDKVYNRMQSTMFKNLPKVFREVKQNKSALTERNKITSVPELEKGSETPTNENNSTKRLKRTDSPEHKNKKIFTCPSDIFFWGKGTNISVKGKQLLDTMADFFKNMPGLLVISEHDNSNKQASINLGINRSIKIISYLKTKGMAPDRFNISPSTTLKQSPQSYEFDSTENARTLEVVLLEKQVYE